ncbi:Iron transporter FTH1 [Nakaseomyces bracarensis]|uniref:Iron transporter FTH1 n=1 Tax=Nakaseomyces bracarensis TaxID=273131 RepID=A0ABR4P149_9SACH
MSFEQVFSFQVFFIFLRESLEIVVIISILLTIVKQGLSIGEHDEDISHGTLPSGTRPATEDQVPLTVEEEEQVYEVQGADASQESLSYTDNLKLYKKLKVQIVSGGALGLVICGFIGGAFVAVFYHVGTDLWTLSEHYYEGVLSLVASLIISVMGLFFLRVGKLREKFRVKLASIIYSDRGKMLKMNATEAVSFSEKYAFFILPFVTALREGLEAVVFIGGVGLDQPLMAIISSMVCAFCISGVFGIFFFKYSSSLSLKICLVITTCFLYLIASGLFSKGVWQLELQDYVNKCNGQDMSEVGNGPGSYDISRSVWHVNCCNGESDGGWMILTAIFGWTNSATYGSVSSYIIYWLALIFSIKMLMAEEKFGYIPGVPIKWQKKRIIKRLKIAHNSLKLKQNLQEPTGGSTIEEPTRTSKDSSTPLIAATNNLHGSTATN